MKVGLLLGVIVTSLPGTASAAPMPGFTETDVMIDVGHGGVDPGTHLDNVKEKDINLAISRVLYDDLKARGYNVVMNRTGDYALSGDNTWLRIRSRHIKDLAQRASLANEVRPKALISIHVNSATTTKKSGPLLIHQKSEESKRLAAQLQGSLNALYHTTDAPKYGRTFYLLKYAKCPTVIVEVGYITNPGDRDKMLDPNGQKAIARHIGDGLEQYLGKSKEGRAE
jgi:N-acetylmuramoyl-L-alanine amidase